MQIFRWFGQRVVLSGAWTTPDSTMPNESDAFRQWLFMLASSLRYQRPMHQEKIPQDDPPFAKTVAEGRSARHLPEDLGLSSDAAMGDKNGLVLAESTGSSFPIDDLEVGKWPGLCENPLCTKALQPCQQRREYGEGDSRNVVWKKNSPQLRTKSTSASRLR